MVSSILDQIELKDYLLRIGIPGETISDIAALKKIHRQHLLNIPFENLDIPPGKKISLDIENLFNKIIREKRGGFCYELNYLFNSLISSIGYRSYMISARVYSDGSYGPEFDHMALIVEAGGKDWLCDVGFGHSFIEPLELIYEAVQTDGRNKFKISCVSGDQFLLSMLENNEWSAKYIFSIKSHTIEDFKEMCRYHSESGESRFTRSRMISQLTENGRVTLKDDKLIITEKDSKKEIMISGNEFNYYLQKYFGIQLKEV